MKDFFRSLSIGLIFEDTAQQRLSWEALVGEAKTLLYWRRQLI